MLLKITKEQAASYWEVLKFGIEKALPPTLDNKYRMDNILESLMKGNMEAWIITGKKKDKDLLLGTMVTTFEDDHCTKIRRLLIYSVFAHKHVPNNEWKEIYNILRRYAREMGCHMISAYTNSARIVELVNNLNGSTSYTYVTLEV